MFELVQHPSNQTNILSYDNESIKLLAVSKESDLAHHDLQLVDGVLVQTFSAYEAEKVVRTIRSNRERGVALKPVFINSTIPNSSSIFFLFDGVFSDETKSSAFQKLKSIQARTREISTDIYQLDYNTSLSQLVTQYLFTRQSSLHPNLSRTSKIGYAYPFLSSVLQEQDSQRLINVLNKTKELGFLTKQTKDHVHTCKKCTGGFLNYRECCPKCSSADLKTDDLIHHFLCAHIAPEGDYKKEDHLECPKCDKHLRHIGIDYDKPSCMHTCNSCDHQFQNAEIKALCIDCGNENELSQLNSLEVCSYELTSLGEQVAKYGIHAKKEPQKSAKLNVLSESMFELFKTKERDRALNNGTQSFEGSLNIDLELLSSFSETQQDVIQQEICTIISNYLSKADIIASQSPNWYKFLIYDSNHEHVTKVGGLIQNNITKLLQDGMKAQQVSAEVLITPLNSTGA